jgi:predicted AAA+ superfamily ATPase
MWVGRPDPAKAVARGLAAAPVTALLGPRQCGKTSLARHLAARRQGSYFDLESPRDLAPLNRPQQTLERLRGLVVLDEIQRRPDLLPLLRVLADRRPLPARFLILGSASPNLMRHASETLAGRIHFVEMSGFSLEEVGFRHRDALWFRGGLPRSYLARTAGLSASWRDDFIRTFLERDIPQLEIRVPAVTLRRFWTMIAHYHGQIWNASEIGSSLGLSHTTMRRYLDLLSGAYVVRQLPPFFENLGKRQVKSPKIYIRDTGLLHALLGIPTLHALESHPKYGFSWEGFVLEQILRWTGDRNAYFWATQSGAELDLLILHGGRRWGVEIKSGDAPTLSKSMRIAIGDLRLDHLWVIHPGPTAYPLDRKADALPLSGIGAIRRRLRL